MTEPASDELIAALKESVPGDLDVSEVDILYSHIQALIARLVRAEQERDELLAKLGAALSEF